MPRLAVFSIAVFSLVACRGDAPPGQPRDQPRPPSERPILDAKVAATCVVTYSCGLSHPGLGTSLDEVSVDLSKCTRSKRSENGPYESNVPNQPARPAPPPPPPVPLPADQCRRVLALVSTITPSDARDAQESAQIDSTACDLEVLCPPGNASKVRIQRQTTAGKSRVEELIRSL